MKFEVSIEPGVSLAGGMGFDDLTFSEPESCPIEPDFAKPEVPTTPTTTESTPPPTEPPDSKPLKILKNHFTLI